MTTLIVKLPARDAAVPSQEWRLADMPFLLLDKRGRTLRAGRAALEQLPRAGQTLLLLAARDVLMLAAAVPPLKGARLKQALPNIIEDQLIQDAQTCHIVLDPLPIPVPESGLGVRRGSGVGADDEATLPLAAAASPSASSAASNALPSRAAGAASRSVVPRALTPAAKRMVAVIDRGWFRFLLDAFTGAGHRGLRAIPIARCLPAPRPDPADSRAPDDAVLDLAETVQDVDLSNPNRALGDLSPRAYPAVAAILGATVSTDPHALPEALALMPPRVEVAIAHGPFGEGLTVPADAVADTLAALATAGMHNVYVLDEAGADAGNAPDRSATVGRRAVHQDASSLLSSLPGAQPLSFETLARNALAQRLDLCQFEFAARPWRLTPEASRRLRAPALLAVAAIVVAIIGVNVQWLMLTRQRDAISARMTALLLEAFPRTTVVLDPAAQMTTQLDRLRTAAGQLSPNDFLSLADGLSRSLGPVPPTAVASLAYTHRVLQVTFKADASVDDSLKERLARNGLDGSTDGNVWTIRSAS
ncbi:MAG: type II secretion system protein GspL [Janthinobacterium lividum]